MLTNVSCSSNANQMPYFMCNQFQNYPLPARFGRFAEIAWFFESTRSLSRILGDLPNQGIPLGSANQGSGIQQRVLDLLRVLAKKHKIREFDRQKRPCSKGYETLSQREKTSSASYKCGLSLGPATMSANVAPMSGRKRNAREPKREIMKGRFTLRFALPQDHRTKQTDSLLR
jgi:hypothetical protein